MLSPLYSALFVCLFVLLAVEFYRAKFINRNSRYFLQISRIALQIGSRRPRWRIHLIQNGYRPVFHTRGGFYFLLMVSTLRLCCYIRSAFAETSIKLVFPYSTHYISFFAVVVSEILIFLSRRSQERKILIDDFHRAKIIRSPFIRNRIYIYDPLFSLFYFLPLSLCSSFLFFFYSLPVYSQYIADR